MELRDCLLRGEQCIKIDFWTQVVLCWRILGIKKGGDMDARVEQQAFAKHGLNHVIEKYPPMKLKKPSKFLP